MDSTDFNKEEVHPEDALHRESHIREQKILIVEKEKKGEYWKILAVKLQEWIIACDKRRMNILDSGVNEKTLKLLEAEKIKMEMLSQVLKINEAIIYENKTWVDRFKSRIVEVKEYVKTFVGYGGENEGRS